MNGDTKIMGIDWDLHIDGDEIGLKAIYDKCREQGTEVQISKSLSYILRHAALNTNLEVRKDGYAKLRHIMQTKDFKGKHTAAEVMAVCYYDSKSRFSMIREHAEGELLVRANQGHTMRVVDDEELLTQLETPEDFQGEAIHGTYLVHWPFIRRQGLSKAARNHIHLAMAIQGGSEIKGMRSSAEVFIYVDIPKAMRDGMIFFTSKNEVILTPGHEGWLSPKYFKKVKHVDPDSATIEDLEFEKIDSPKWPAEYAPIGPTESDTYTVKNIEAVITKQKKRYLYAIEVKRRIECGDKTVNDEEEKLAQNITVLKEELASLEQRKKQQGGPRNRNQVSPAEDDQTVVARQPRDATPPWKRAPAVEEQKEQEKWTNHGITEKDNQQWSALRTMKDNAIINEAERVDKSVPQNSAGSTASGSAGPPKFFNSNKTGGISWRNKTSNSTNASKDRSGTRGQYQHEAGSEGNEACSRRASVNSQRSDLVPGAGVSGSASSTNLDHFDRSRDATPLETKPGSGTAKAQGFSSNKITQQSRNQLLPPPSGPGQKNTGAKTAARSQNMFGALAQDMDDDDDDDDFLSDMADSSPMVKAQHTPKSALPSKSRGGTISSKDDSESRSINNTSSTVNVLQKSIPGPSGFSVSSSTPSAGFSVSSGRLSNSNTNFNNALNVTPSASGSSSSKVAELQGFTLSGGFGPKSNLSKSLTPGGISVTGKSTLTPGGPSIPDPSLSKKGVNTSDTPKTTNSIGSTTTVKSAWGKPDKIEAPSADPGPNLNLNEKKTNQSTSQKSSNPFGAAADIVSQRREAAEIRENAPLNDKSTTPIRRSGLNSGNSNLNSTGNQSTNGLRVSSNHDSGIPKSPSTSSVKPGYTSRRSSDIKNDEVYGKPIRNSRDQEQNGEVTIDNQMGKSNQTFEKPKTKAATALSLLAQEKIGQNSQSRNQKSMSGKPGTSPAPETESNSTGSPYEKLNRKLAAEEPVGLASPVLDRQFESPESQDDIISQECSDCVSDHQLKTQSDKSTNFGKNKGQNHGSGPFFTPGDDSAKINDCVPNSNSHSVSQTRSHTTKNDLSHSATVSTPGVENQIQGNITSKSENQTQNSIMNSDSGSVSTTAIARGGNATGMNPTGVSQNDSKNSISNEKASLNPSETGSKNEVESETNSNTIDAEGFDRSKAELVSYQGHRGYVVTTDDGVRKFYPMKHLNAVNTSKDTASGSVVEKSNMQDLNNSKTTTNNVNPSPQQNSNIQIQNTNQMNITQLVANSQLPVQGLPGQNNTNANQTDHQQQLLAELQQKILLSQAQNQQQNSMQNQFQANQNNINQVTNSNNQATILQQNLQLQNKAVQMGLEQQQQQQRMNVNQGNNVNNILQNIIQQNQANQQQSQQSSQIMLLQTAQGLVAMPIEFFNLYQQQQNSLGQQIQALNLSSLTPQQQQQVQIQLQAQKQQQQNLQSLQQNQQNQDAVSVLQQQVASLLAGNKNNLNNVNNTEYEQMLIQQLGQQMNMNADNANFISQFQGSQEGTNIMSNQIPSSSLSIDGSVGASSVTDATDGSNIAGTRIFPKPAVNYNIAGTEPANPWQKQIMDQLKSKESGSDNNKNASQNNQNYSSSSIDISDSVQAAQNQGPNSFTDSQSSKTSFNTQILQQFAALDNNKNAQNLGLNQQNNMQNIMLNQNNIVSLKNQVSQQMALQQAQQQAQQIQKTQLQQAILNQQRQAQNQNLGQMNLNLQQQFQNLQAQQQGNVNQNFNKQQQILVMLGNNHVVTTGGDAISSAQQLELAAQLQNPNSNAPNAQNGNSNVGSTSNGQTQNMNKQQKQQQMQKTNSNKSSIGNNSSHGSDSNIPQQPQQLNLQRSLGMSSNTPSNQKGGNSGKPPSNKNQSTGGKKGSSGNENSNIISQSKGQGQGNTKGGTGSNSGTNSNVQNQNDRNSTSNQNANQQQMNQQWDRSQYGSNGYDNQQQGQQYNQQQYANMTQAQQQWAAAQVQAQANQNNGNSNYSGYNMKQGSNSATQYPNASGVAGKGNTYNNGNSNASDYNGGPQQNQNQSFTNQQQNQNHWNIAMAAQFHAAQGYHNTGGYGQSLYGLNVNQNPNAMDWTQGQAAWSINAWCGTVSQTNNTNSNTQGYNGQNVIGLKGGNTNMNNMNMNQSWPQQGKGSNFQNQTGQQQQSQTHNNSNQIQNQKGNSGQTQQNQSQGQKGSSKGGSGKNTASDDQTHAEKEKEFDDWLQKRNIESK